jgi:hypothetical protein
MKRSSQWKDVNKPSLIPIISVIIIILYFFSFMSMSLLTNLTNVSVMPFPGGLLILILLTAGISSIIIYGLIKNKQWVWITTILLSVIMIILLITSVIFNVLGAFLPLIVVGGHAALILTMLFPLKGYFGKA